MYAKSDLEAIKAKVSILDYLEKQGSTFRQTGNSYVTLCPIHNEKSGSFHVRPDFGTFHCFGCGASGDIFSLVQAMEQLSFTGAIQMLAEESGVVLEAVEEDEEYKKRKRLYALLSLTSKWFKSNYDGLEDSHPAKQNLIQRNLLKQAAGDPFIGYAPISGLTEYLKSKGFTEDEMLETGVLKTDPETKKTKEVFRNRLIWTVNDIQGRPVGFSGRKLADDNSPKYLNSPATKLYNKSQLLLGLDYAKKEAVRQKLLYIVEGQTDIMAFRAAGIDNVAATCGTAFGTEHADMILRIAQNSKQSEHFKIIFCFDGDAAGVNAAKKVFEKAKQIQLNAYVIKFEEDDPCDIRLKQGDIGLLSAIRQSPMHIVEFILKEELQNWEIDSPQGQAGYINFVKTVLKEINDKTAYNGYMRKASEWTGISYSKLAIEKQNTNGKQRTVIHKENLAETTFLAAMLQYPTETLPLVEKYSISKDYFSDPELFEKVINSVREEGLNYSEPKVAVLSVHPLNIPQARAATAIEIFAKNLLKKVYEEELEQSRIRIFNNTEEQDDALMLFMQEQDNLKKKFFIK